MAGILDRGRGCRRGLLPRPSLSVPRSYEPLHRPGSVAGVYSPAFVERFGIKVQVSQEIGVSPGFTPRPSLSDRRQVRSATRE